MPGPTAVLICDDIPMEGRSGHQSYLKNIVDYFEHRGLTLHIISFSDRFPSLIQKSSSLHFAPNIHFKSNYLLKIGNWVIPTSLKSWFRPIVRSLLGTARKAKPSPAGAPGAPNGTAYIGRFLKADEQSVVEKLIQETSPDFVLVDTIFRFTEKIYAHGARRTVLIAHDVFHQKSISLSRVYNKVVPFITRDRETEILQRFPHILAISDDDRNALAEMAPGSEVITLSPPMRYQAGPRLASAQRCVFVGSGATHNVDGINWFLTRIWPEIRKACPAAEIDIVGTVCRHVADGDGIRRHHVVEDVGNVLLLATCSINPLRAGSGMKVKMIDYISFGLPVVTTEIGAQGFVQDGSEPFVVCDDEAAFAAAVAQLLDSPSDAQALSSRCRAYTDGFSHERNFSELDRIFLA